MTLLERLQAINEASAFSRWAGFVPTVAEPGRAEIQLSMRANLGNHAGYLHAGVTQGLVDTVCGYAAATLAGPVVTSHCAVDFYAPAAGNRFVARARVIKAGRRQIFVTAEIFTNTEAADMLVAGGSAVLVPLAQTSTEG
jgi:uncharacterized protein (TIGR00369 family)